MNLPVPSIPSKEKRKKEKKKKKERKRKERWKAHYNSGGPGPPSFPSSPEPSVPLSKLPSGNTRLVLIHPILVSLITNTASVDLSFHNHLVAGAFGCFHPCAFPIAFHIFEYIAAKLCTQQIGVVGSAVFVHRTTSTCRPCLVDLVLKV